MLEAIRRFGVERRWVFGLVLGVVTVAFVGSMGWMGLSGPSGAYAAKVNGEVVLLTDYQEAYRNTYREYERRLGDNFSTELIDAIDLPTQVIMGLVDRKLWLSMAHDLGLVASDKEVRDALVEIPAFRGGGRFNSRLYLEILQRLRTTPEAFEAGVREDLVIEKARRIVASAAQVTDADLVGQGEEDPGLAPDEAAGRRAERRQALLNRKRAQLMAAYTDHLRSHAKIRIFRENLQNLGLG